MFVFLAVLLPSFTSCIYHRFQPNQRTTQCRCVPQHLCPDDTALFGHGVLDPRIGRCPHPDEICCDLPQDPPSRCGLRHEIKSRITSGSTAAFGELPWNLIIQESEGNLYKCGASLIHPKVALTAAHCVEPYSEEPEKILVRAGEWDTDSRDEPLPFQDNFVEEILIHDQYRPASLKNDIAMLILSEDYRLTGNVGVVCLATAGEKITENRCVASGWGKNAYSKGKYSSVLKKVEVPLMDRGHCLETLRATRLGPRYSLDKSFICAGGKRNQDSCKGDGGSPLVCPLFQDGQRFVQIGIVSWGLGCGQEGIPGVYVNVPIYLDWIENEMRYRDLDPNSFKL